MFSMLSLLLLDLSGLPGVTLPLLSPAPSL